MDEQTKLSRVKQPLSELSYPISRERAADELTDVTLLLADGQINLGDVIERTRSQQYQSVDDLETSLHNALPRNAVGEPYQSEGEG